MVGKVLLSRNSLPRDIRSASRFFIKIRITVDDFGKNNNELLSILRYVKILFELFVGIDSH